ncbi:MAG: NfeD family protein [Gammaproteobacteria bacterium]|nr:NfeD family protein [Gammaproteobacteria bacterium]
MMGEFEFSFWYWWVLGLILLILEVFAPGAFFLWMGISAGVVGVIAWLAPSLSIEWQMLIFTVIAIASVVGWRAYLRKNPVQTDQPSLNRRGEQYVGRVFTLDEPIVNGVGKIRVDDTMWRIEGADLEAGGKVRVVGVDGVNLRVESEA